MLYKIIRVNEILILFLFLNIMLLNAQKNMDYTFEELKTKSKNELIQIAKDLLKERYPKIILNINDFDIRVWNNPYGKLEVVFRRSIRYVSSEIENINYDITMNLNTKEIIPFDNQDMLFYTPSKKADKAIGELKEKGLLPKNNQTDIEYTITENSEYYLISCFDNLHHIDKSLITNQEHPYLSKTIINKKTGKTIFLKGDNPFYFLTQRTFEGNYKENLYAFLKEGNIPNKNAEIIKIASSILKEKQPDLKLNLDDFEIMILGNYKDLIVKYRRFIRFKKSNDKTVFDLAINIITKEIFPFNSSEVPFYIPLSSDKKTINIIQKKIQLDRNPNIEHTILENEDHFWIASISGRDIKKYLINKKNLKIVWTDESSILQSNNREDLSLQEHYKRMNQLFNINPEKNNQPLLNIASGILKERQFIPNINLDNYSTTYKASKNEIEVTFTRLVKFIPLRHKEKSNLNYNLNVKLVDKTVDQKTQKFYFPTKEDIIITKLIETKLAGYLDDFEKTYYPIEIIEEKNFFSIRVSDNSGSIPIANTEKRYHMNKTTKIIEEVLSPSIPIYPSPHIKPGSFKEIKH